MSLLPRDMRWWRLAWLLSVTLTGCATTPPASRQPLSADQQRNLLQDLAVFSFTGRVAVATGTPSVEWRQQHDAASVKLALPLGVGSLQLDYSPKQLRLVSSRGVELMNADAEQELKDQLGFVPPFAALSYWVRGVPAPATVAAETYDAAGRLTELTQQDWLIRYQRYVAVDTAAGSLQLPALLVATRDDLRLKLVVDRWRIK